MKRIVSDEHPDYPVQPSHIDASRHFFDAFGNHEAEVSAGWIIRLCQQKGGWFPFTQAELDVPHREKYREAFNFNRLLSDGYIIKGDDEKYRVTHEFIARCFLASPRR